MSNYDFCGWATRANLKCSDGRTIMKDAFKDNDGKKVPLVWNHQHNDPNEVLGHAMLENRDEGVYAYCKFNGTESGRTAKMLVQHGDVCALSIYANQLKQSMSNVVHGNIREVSLVLAGANPGAFIDSASIAHGDGECDDEALIYTGLKLELIHSDEEDSDPLAIIESLTDEQKEAVYTVIGLALENVDTEIKHSDENKEENNMDNEKTIADVFNSLTDEQQEVVYAIIGEALENSENDEEDEDMKHNVFDNDYADQGAYLSHADEEGIIAMAKTPGIGSLQQALGIFADQNELSHDAFDGEAMGMLLPDYQLLDPKAPKILYPDDTWVESVINGVHKSPVSRVRTRRADARQAELQANGYKKGDPKKEMGKIQLLGRTHDAQTIYVKDKLNRDDIIDITDFDIVAYQWDIMRHTLDQTLAQAILIGDGRELTDPDKIKEDHIRPIWKDDDLYCIHYNVDFDATATSLQGDDTETYFGENFIKSEAIIAAALYSREQYKGSGNMTFYCTPHLLNVMLLARDRNGARMYSSKNDLAAALNVKDIKTVEQFENQTRVDGNGATKKLLGLFVNLADYQLGCVKGGQITKFEDFDIDFNQMKLLLETRASGALVEWYSAIALEETVSQS